MMDKTKNINSRKQKRNSRKTDRDRRKQGKRKEGREKKGKWATKLKREIFPILTN